MTVSILQFLTPKGDRRIAAIADNGSAARINSVTTVYELTFRAIEENVRLETLISTLGLAESVDLSQALQEKRLLPPIDHADPAHLYVTGTGLTHLGSAESRDAMHRETMSSAEQTDSMKMFLMGVKDGKPLPGQIGVQPEWFYKGNGDCLTAPEAPLCSPAFAMYGGEEPEIAGVYVIGPGSVPARIGFCLANEFSDHVMEKVNYLWLSHSKLRPIALGPELLIGELPQTVRGTSRIFRGGTLLWEKAFFSGETNMSHALDNLEKHHFKYEFFRRPGDVHVHCFGTATLSFSDSIRTQPGDLFEIQADAFRLPLRNVLAIKAGTPPDIRVL